MSFYVYLSRCNYCLASAGISRFRQATLVVCFSSREGTYDNNSKQPLHNDSVLTVFETSLLPLKSDIVQPQCLSSLNCINMYKMKKKHDDGNCQHVYCAVVEFLEVKSRVEAHISTCTLYMIMCICSVQNKLVFVNVEMISLSIFGEKHNDF